MRRLFRLVLRLGVVAAAAYAVKRTMDGRQAEPAGDGWRAVEPPSPIPPRAPVVPVVEPEVVEIGQVAQPGEPEVGTDSEPQPAKKAVAKKVPAKKAAAKTQAPAKKAAATRSPAKKKAPAKRARPLRADDTDPGGDEPIEPLQ